MVRLPYESVLTFGRIKLKFKLGTNNVVNIQCQSKVNKRCSDETILHNGIKDQYLVEK